MAGDRCIVQEPRRERCESAAFVATSRSAVRHRWSKSRARIAALAVAALPFLLSRQAAAEECTCNRFKCTNQLGIFTKIDTNRDGHISAAEAAVIPPGEAKARPRIDTEVFAAMDKNNNGKIEAEEFQVTYVYSTSEMMGADLQWCVRENLDYTVKGECRSCETSCVDDVCGCGQCDSMPIIMAVCCFVLAFCLCIIFCYCAAKRYHTNRRMTAYEQRRQKVAPEGGGIQVASMPMSWLYVPVVAAIFLVAAGIGALYMKDNFLDKSEKPGSSEAPSPVRRLIATIFS